MPGFRKKFRSTINDGKWLAERFQKRGMSMAAIAREAGCSVTSVQRALRTHLGIDSAKRPSEKSERQLQEIRNRSLARRMFEKEPCLVCGEEGTLNHIDGDTSNNEPDNVEWLCRSHHLMVDKRLAARAVRWFRERHRSLWLEWHDEVLRELRRNPNPLPR